MSAALTGQALAQSERPLLIAHMDPDGDALGATLGLMHLLEALGKRPVAYSRGPIPDEYAFLPGMDRLAHELPDPAEIDMVVLLDCHEPKRTGPQSRDYLEAFGKAAVIDHHRGETDFGQTVWVDPSYAATCQMLADLALEMGWSIGPEAAACLFVGVQTDTGSFRYSNATPRVFHTAALLVERGADVWAISQEVYATRPKRLQLQGEAMGRLTTLADGRLAVSQVTLEDLSRARAEAPDLEELVEMLRGIPGVQVGLLLRQRAEGGVKISMRARGQVDVSEVAISLGGGGHRNAAGAILHMDMDQARETVCGLLLERLGAGK